MTVFTEAQRCALHEVSGSARKKADELKADLEALKARWEKQRVKSRAYSRARSGAMSSLGMKRSRYGGWE